MVSSRSSLELKSDWARTSTGWVVELAMLDELLPHEEHNEASAMALSGKIAASGIWTAPIVADADHKIVMDGHHRLRAACILHLTHVPVVFTSYSSPAVRMEAWRPGEGWSPRDIVDRATKRNLLPYKTTRHIFSPEVGSTQISISLLRNY